MKDRNNSERTVQRRDVIKGAAAAGLIAATGTHALVHAAESRSVRSDLIQRENAKPGTRDWMLTKTLTVPGKINKILDNGPRAVEQSWPLTRHGSPNLRSRLTTFLGTQASARFP